MAELIPIVLFICIAGVLILRPVTKKLGILMEAMARERTAQRPAVAREIDELHLERITVALDRLNTRLDRVDDRMSFMERLVENRPPQRLTG